jgi:hypothetical protein
MLFKLISLPILIISFLIGLIIVYIYGPETKTIYIYPGPDNYNKILFRDKANNCFGFNEEKIECPKDESLLSKIPIQN